MRTSDHFDGHRFFNPGGATGQPFAALPRLFRTPRTPWPSSVDVQPRPPAGLDGARAAVTFIGHSSWLVQTAAGNLLLDPMYSRRAGPLNWYGPARVRVPAVAFEALPPVSIVLLSHNHYDHCDLATLRRLARRFDPLVVTPLGNAALVRSAGIRRVEEIDWWEPARTAPLEIVLTPAQHFSARNPFDRNRALWGGFTITAASSRIYFAGDTGYGSFFCEIRERLGPIDLALLPIGAYEPRWFMKDIHMNPAEAVQAHVDLGAKQSLGMHYGTFQLTTEGIDDPLRELADARERMEVEADAFRVLEFGASLRV